MKNAFVIKEGKVFIEVYCKGKTVTAIIDEIDFEKVNKFEGTWSGMVTDGTGKVYVFMDRRVKGKRKCFYLHRVIMGLEYDKDFVVDHCSFNTLDNTRSNLKAMSSKRNLVRTNREKAQVRRKGSSWRVLVRGEIVGEFETKQEALIQSVFANKEHFPELEKFMDFDTILEKLGTTQGKEEVS
ncbi:hypothetical protein [Peribacillus sp. YIM B13477]|uniref:hypothetical protein n=1 Tax=Peribacillus sp. YIM B13477 TaxID=3366300 RepID=UPI003672BB6E